MKTKSLGTGIVLTLLLSCGSQQIPSSSNASVKSMLKATAEMPSFDEEKVFDIENARRKIDTLGIDDPRLKEHLLNVAIYAAYKAGKTDLIPTVYPIN